MHIHVKYEIILISVRSNSMTTNKSPSLVSRYARYTVQFSKLNVFISLLFMVGMLFALPNLYKDTRADAFLAEDNPALVYRNKVKEQFGLSDPIVIAVVNKSDEGVFNPKTLQLVNWITEQIIELEILMPIG